MRRLARRIRHSRGWSNPCLNGAPAQPASRRSPGADLGAKAPNNGRFGANGSWPCGHKQEPTHSRENCMIFDRVKPLDEILATAEKKSLHRSLGWFQLMLFGIGSIIGTGIFVLTAAGAQKAGPGLMLAFVIAGLVCIVTALCYAEIAAMVPVAGSAYTYTYVTMGEFLAWTVGWALVLEYAIAASAVSVGWSGYFTGTILQQFFGLYLPP